MQYFDINLAPGAVREINVQGSFVYFLSGSAGGADTTIELRAVSGSDTVLLKPGQAFRLGSSANQRWVVANHLGEGTIIGQLLMGDGDFSDNRISGSVEVIDGSRNRVLAGSAFAMNIYNNVATGTAAVQLWNPPASGKRLIVERVMAGADVADLIYVGFNTAALSDLVAAPPRNKLSSGSATSGAEARNNFSSTAFVIPLADRLVGLWMQAAQSQPIPSIEPLIVMPGYGLVASRGNTTGGAISVNFDFFEEGIAA